MTLTIPYNSLASFNEIGNCWQVESGTYKILIAKNAADIKPLTATVFEEGNITERVKPCLSFEQK